MHSRPEAESNDNISPSALKTVNKAHAAMHVDMHKIEAEGSIAANNLQILNKHFREEHTEIPPHAFEMEQFQQLRKELFSAQLGLMFLNLHHEHLVAENTQIIALTEALEKSLQSKSKLARDMKVQRIKPENVDQAISGVVNDTIRYNQEMNSTRMLFEALMNAAVPTNSHASSLRSSQDNTILLESSSADISPQISSPELNSDTENFSEESSPEPRRLGR
jgi:hypothetical protein